MAQTAWCACAPATARHVQVCRFYALVNVHTVVVVARRGGDRLHLHPLVFVVALEDAVLVAIAEVVEVADQPRKARPPPLRATVPAPETEFYLCVHAQELHVAREAFPGDCTGVERIFDVGGRPEVHVVH